MLKYLIYLCKGYPGEAFFDREIVVYTPPKGDDIPKLDFAVTEAIFTQPYIKAIHLLSDKIKSRNTARKYLDQLCNIQVLELWAAKV